MALISGNRTLTPIISEPANGTVTATGEGQTYIKLYNQITNASYAVKVNVTGNQGKTYPKLEGGTNHFVSLKANGSVWVWGDNSYGQFGLGNKEKQYSAYFFQCKTCRHLFRMFFGISFTFTEKLFFYVNRYFKSFVVIRSGFLNNFIFGQSLNMILALAKFVPIK